MANIYAITIAIANSGRATIGFNEVIEAKSYTGIAIFFL